MSSPQPSLSVPLLSLKDCTIQFGGLTAVSALNLEIGSQELIGLIGPNGAGKTTLFNLITGVYQPTGGSIDFEGRSLLRHKPNQITERGIGNGMSLLIFAGIVSGLPRGVAELYAGRGPRPQTGNQVSDSELGHPHGRPRLCP